MSALILGQKSTLGSNQMLWGMSANMKFTNNKKEYWCWWASKKINMLLM